MQRISWLFLLTFSLSAFALGCGKQAEPDAQDPLPQPANGAKMINRRFNGPPPVVPMGSTQQPQSNVEAMPR